MKRIFFLIFFIFFVFLYFFNVYAQTIDLNDNLTLILEKNRKLNLIFQKNNNLPFIPNLNQHREVLKAMFFSINFVKIKNPVMKFIGGPNYKELKNIKEYLAWHKEFVRVLKIENKQIKNNKSFNKVMNDYISFSQNLSFKIDDFISKEEKVFSLFGWLNKIISRY